MNLRRSRATLPLAAFAMMFSLTARDARAGDRAASEALFNDGQKLFAAGQIHEACEKFSEAYAQDNTAIGALINLARCHEKEGKTASAWAEYKTVEVFAGRDNQKDREAFAHDEAGKLEPTLHKFALNVKFPVEGIEITRNGTTVGRGQWGTELPIDPGDVTLKATAPGKIPWTFTMHLAPGPGVDHYDVPALKDAPVEAPAGGGDAIIVTSNGLGTGKIVGLVLAGTGVVAAGIGVGFQLTALSQDSASNNLSGASTTEIEKNPTVCGVANPPAAACPQTTAKTSDHNAAKNDQNIAIPLIAGGAGLLVAGVVVFLTSGSAETTKKTQKATWQVLPTVAPGQTGMAVVGTF